MEISVDCTSLLKMTTKENPSSEYSITWIASPRKTDISCLNNQPGWPFVCSFWIIKKCYDKILFMWKLRRCHMTLLKVKFNQIITTLYSYERLEVWLTFVLNVIQTNKRWLWSDELVTNFRYISCQIMTCIIHISRTYNYC